MGTAKEMKAAFLDPYLDTLGGGERYFLTLASFLAHKNWQVDVFWPDNNLAKKAQINFGIDLKRVNFLPVNFFQIKLLKKVKILKNYDLSFYISDGSVPFLLAKKNILHFQVPFHDVGGRNFGNQVKLKTINKIVCNSKFTKKFIDQEYGVKSKVIYPPVAVDKLAPQKKENIILSVARFTDLLHDKGQDFLVNAFKQIVETGLKGWRLVLAGNDKEGKKLVKKLRKISQGYPVEIKTNLSFVNLCRLFGKARIFWTASGFGIDEEKYPEKMEHFGITTVEAMAAGCVPVVVAKGGQREIVSSGKDGLLWQTKEELIKLTQKLIKDGLFLKKLSQEAQKKSLVFNTKRFFREYEKII